MKTRNVFHLFLALTILVSGLSLLTPNHVHAEGNITEFLSVQDYLYQPKLGSVIEVILMYGGAQLQISYDGETFELTRDLIAGSNFFQTYGWIKFRFVAKDGYQIFTPVQNESRYWDGSGVVFSRHIFKSYLPLVFYQ